MVDYGIWGTGEPKTAFLDSPEEIRVVAAAKDEIKVSHLLEYRSANQGIA
jgi:hypothetical protein